VEQAKHVLYMKYRRQTLAPWATDADPSVCRPPWLGLQLKRHQTRARPSDRRHASASVARGSAAHGVAMATNAVQRLTGEQETRLLIDFPKWSLLECV
jgi:hypothetical protein